MTAFYRRAKGGEVLVFFGTSVAGKYDPDLDRALRFTSREAAMAWAREVDLPVGVGMLTVEEVESA